MPWLTWLIGIGVNLGAIVALVVMARRGSGPRRAALLGTYAMVVAGALAMFLLQSSLNAGRLIAAQPGLTCADPIVSILWGVLGFAESVRGGWFLVLAAVSAAVIGLGVVRLSGSPLVAGSADSDEQQPASSSGGRTSAPKPAAAG